MHLLFSNPHIVLIPHRISVVCSQFPPVRSGYARVAFEVDRGLEKLGHQVSVVTEGSGCRRTWNFPFLTEEGRKAIESSEAVVMIGPSPPFTEQAFRAARTSGIPVVYVTNAFVGISSYFDNILTRVIDGLYEKVAYRRRLNRSMFVFAQTEGFARYLHLKRTVTVSPYGIRHLPEVTPRVRKRRVLFVGQFRHYKGIRYLLDAAEIMRSNGDCPVIDIAGSGPLLNWMTKIVMKRGLSDIVNIIVSPDDEAIASLYATDRVFVLPSVSAESFGFVLLEAASRGMSIVTSDLPGLADVSRSLGGLVVPRRNADLLAEKIVEAMDSNAQTVADLTPFSWEKHVNLLEEAVDKAVGKMGGVVYAVPARR